MDKTEQTHLILQYHNEGFSPAEIAHKGVECSRSSVHLRLKKLGFTPNRNKHLGLRQINDQEAVCNRCNKIKPLTEFYRSESKSSKGYARSKTGYSSFCKDCSTTRLLTSKNLDINNFLKMLYSHTKSRAKTKILIFEITLQEYQDLYFKQEGKCFYTDIEMDWGHGKGRSKYSISLDRIIPEKGYVIDNVVFCINKVNYVKSDVTLEEMKEWMPLWYDKIQTKLNHGSIIKT